MDSTTDRRSVPLAAILVVIVGVIHVLSGMAAITASDSITATAEVDDVLYGINVESWGWFWLAGGIAQLLTAIFLFARNPIAASAAVLGAATNAMTTIFVLFAFPLWAITVLALEVAIIWKITQNFDDFIDD